MRKLVTPDNWLKNTVTEQEANAFNPDLGPCCDPIHFRVHLAGTTANLWNKSATGVFVNHFLAAHPEYPSREEPVRKMVQMRCHATLDSMIRKYRKSNTPRSKEQMEAERLERNRAERKRKVGSVVSILSRADSDQLYQLFQQRYDVVLMYPSLEHHRGLLEQLTHAGMSSDEERTVGLYTQYEIIEPAWRSEIVTAWLRVFDALRVRARRLDGVYGDQRGSPPRMRIGQEKRSTNKKFVPGLPRNAYDNAWFNRQVHPEDTVRPGPPAPYLHNSKTLE